MKRFILVLVLILVLASLAAWVTVALADTGPMLQYNPGYSGNVTLTDYTCGVNCTYSKIDITSLTDSSGGVVTGIRTSAIYNGSCSGLTLPGATPYENLSSSYVNGYTETMALHHYDYPIPAGDTTYTIAISNPKDGTKGACIDVGMPSTYHQNIIFRITYFPVTGGTLSQDLKPPKTLIVTIDLQGNLTGLTYLAYVRKGTCSKLDSVPPLYQLENVVDGKSISTLSRDSFLPQGYAVDVEKPGATLGDYVACTETGPPSETSPTVTPGPGPGSQPCTTFAQTGHTVCGKFRDYWNNHGGLVQQGYPISDAFQEISDIDGKTYTVQYFERAVFEYHPENRPPYDVLLSLLGDAYYKQKYPNGAPNQTPNTSPGSQLFTETGHRLGGKFLDYWNSHGGLAQQGYPISDEFLETSATDGKVYRVQYFERAEFELHPENQPPYDVLLSLLGTFTYQEKYPHP